MFVLGCVEGFLAYASAGLLLQVKNATFTVGFIGKDEKFQHHQQQRPDYGPAGDS